MELFKLLGKIAIDSADAEKDLDRVSEEGKKTEKNLTFSDRVSAGFKKIGSAAGVLGKAIATGIAAGTVALGGFAVKSVQMAGELEQQLGGSEAVFGEFAAALQKTAAGAWETAGLSQTKFLETANKMGALMQGSGLTIEQSMDLSSAAMQRAADVASIMGIDTEAAMESIAGAAKGNFTMMDNLGVAMNDTAIKAYAMSKGTKASLAGMYEQGVISKESYDLMTSALGKSTDKMTQQEKVALAMGMFLDKSAYAAGNYAKENETLSGSLTTAKAALDNFMATGTGIEDVISSALRAADVIAKMV